MNISFSLSALCRIDGDSARKQAPLNKILLKNPSSIKMRGRDSYRGRGRPSLHSVPTGANNERCSVFIGPFFVYKKEDDSLCMLVFPTTCSVSCANATRKKFRTGQEESALIGDGS